MAKLNNLTIENLWQWRQRFPHWVIVKPIFENEIAWIKEAAAARQQNGMAQGFKNRAASDSTEWHEAGLIGELAAALFYRAKIARVTARTARELNMGDLGGHGDFIEVKTTRGENPWRWDLLETERYIKPHRAYVNALSCVFPEAVILTGWAWGYEFLEGSTIERGVHGLKVRAISPEKQRTPNSLWDEIFDRTRKKESTVLKY